MVSLLRQPLAQFLLVGFTLFIAYRQYVVPTQIQERTIEISDQRLKNYWQFRTKRFDAEAVEVEFGILSSTQKLHLIQDYVREEVLFREANNLELAKNDFVIRQRLIQKMEFLSRDFAEAELSEAQVNSYYQSHQQNYRKPASLTFSHIFFSNTADIAQQGRLVELRAQLNGEQVTPERAGDLGEAFLYNRHYMKRNVDVVKSHFGSLFTQNLQQLPVTSGKWLGPIASEHGWHLVFLLDREAARLPKFDEIKDNVIADAHNFYRRKVSDELIAGLIDGYHVVNLSSVMVNEVKGETQ
ncbi:peptidyl-prolyl cis-trans isomerase [Pseudoalteromonas piscicida]|uniref:peptidylprolyl isomerase n=1 Tax=Pseudoalteromonas piscicida TaxID=43662 RepID=A0AAD0RLT8_PSEO7|nr:peptidylprolyl isomerase [Pseudoalteromonas piscicida]ASD69522.1 hypothetical protein B1L02_21860 [Pseudoalteromonas piscicida]AXR04120.1 peptidyl-prolyl cis-trans isomerase [Pseudoalteromonas piscicida]